MEEKEFDNENIESQNRNEYDIRLRFDAFTAGIKNGGLRSVATINLLVCYIIASINNKVTAQNIIDTVAEGEIANHFEISNAIAKLIQSGVIVEDEEGTLTLAVDSPESIELIEHDLPLTIRDNAIKILENILIITTKKVPRKAGLLCLHGICSSFSVSDYAGDLCAPVCR